jgi:oligoendopeptidase F
VAEVASTFNEYLLQDHMLSGDLEPEQRIFLLGGFLERLRQTVFRQVMFAEFQLEMHKRAEAGETLTGESLSEIYLGLLRAYHGHERGVMEIDDLYAVEWAYIMHFYRGFYVFQYATGMVASIALAEQVVAGAPGAVDRYLQFLSSGSSDYPVELLRKAGADLTTSEPFDIAMAAANRAMDEIEELLPKLEAAD